MSSNELRIWYLLVDASGNTFKNATADKVSVPSDAIIDDLRKAVKQKNDAILPNVVVAQLKVLKCKDELSSEPLKNSVVWANLKKMPCWYWYPHQTAKHLKSWICPSIPILQ